MLANSAPLATSVLMELAESACSKSARSYTTNSLIDRAGSRQPVQVDAVGHWTLADVDGELSLLLGLEQQELFH